VRSRRRSACLVGDPGKGAAAPFPRKGLVEAVALLLPEIDRRDGVVDDREGLEVTLRE
jgi:hypothetical protein